MALADLNVLGAFNQARDLSMKEGANNLQQVGALQGILAKVKADQLATAFRDEMSRATTPDEQAAVAVKFGDPTHVLANATRVAGQKATQESARARLTQALTIADMAHQDRMRNATTAEARAAEAARHNGIVEAIQRDAVTNSGSRLAYDTGAIPANSAAPTPPTVTPPATKGITVQGSFPEANANISNASPELLAAAAAKEPELAAILSRAGITLPSIQPTMRATPTQPATEQPIALTPATPDNLDARDRGAMSRGPVMGTTPLSPNATPAAPTAPTAPVMPQFTGSPREINQAKNKWLQDQSKTSNAGGGVLSPEALKLVVEQYRAGDPRAMQGWARGQTNKVALTNELAKQALAAGEDGKALAATMAEFEGFRAGQRVVGTREAQLSIAADVTSKFVPIAIEASEKLDRTDAKLVNQAIQGVLGATASPELRRFAAANNALVNVYARAINPQGVATVSDKDHAREILSTAFSKGDYRAGAEQLKVEVDTELKSPGSVKRDMRERFTGTSSPKPSSPSQGNAPQNAIDYLKANPGTKDAFKAKYGYIPSGI